MRLLRFFLVAAGLAVAYGLGRRHASRRSHFITAEPLEALEHLAEQCGGVEVLPAGHPVWKLIKGQDEITRAVAVRTDACIRRIDNDYASWLAGKTGILRDDQDPHNLSAVLGEIRALGELAAVWGNQIECRGAGGDFRIVVDGKSVGIEVFTAQGRSDRTVKELVTQRHEGILIREALIAPLGLPERVKDVVQGEASSYLASRKGREHQFTDDISILWIDMQDPVVFPLGFGIEQFSPLVSFRQTLTTGAFWSAFYAEKGDPLFDSVSTEGFEGKVYNLEFPGRFNQNSKLDFVIADIGRYHIVMQNHKRQIQIPAQLFRDLWCLPGFSAQNCWVDWPLANSLAHRIEEGRQTILGVVDAFRR